MMLGYKKLGGIILGTAALLALLPAGANAQFIRYSPIFWSFEGRGGVAIPTSDLGDVADAGATLGGGFAYFLNPRFALRLDGNIDFLRAKESTALPSSTGAPNVHVFHYLGGFEVHLTDPSTSQGMVALTGGFGGVTFDTDAFSFTRANGAQVIGAGYDQTYFALNGGIRLGLNASELVTLFASGRLDVMFGDEEDSQFLAELFGIQPFGTTVSIPIEGGIRINVP